MIQPICQICENASILKAQSQNVFCLKNEINLSSIRKKCEKFNIHPDKDFTIIVDSRENRPWFFDKLNNDNFPNLKYVNGGLKTGDYSITGFSDPEKHEKTICVERKSLEDLYGTVGSGRERFERELIRMQKFTQKAIIIEADLYTIIKNPPDYTRMPPKAVFRSLIAFSMRYGVQVWPCKNRSMAEKTAFIMLDRFYKDQVGEFSKTMIFKPGRFFLDEDI